MKNRKIIRFGIGIVVLIFILQMLFGPFTSYDVDGLGKYIDKHEAKWDRIFEKARHAEQDSSFFARLNSTISYFGSPLESVEYVEKNGSYNCRLRNDWIKDPTWIKGSAYYEQTLYCLVYNEELLLDELFNVWGKGTSWTILEKSKVYMLAETTRGYLCVEEVRPNWYLVSMFMNT